jgi:hypothetical protein
MDAVLLGEDFGHLDSFDSGRPAYRRGGDLGSAE